ncbi:hypothetical protein AAF712_011745 [Marasmius tenuissimus]|uniref:Uncharacterized protein n=1 Tax=Marasmius tenuissimus TaxID=585030 RepID=A0ABR2ZIN6_9AGAR
MAERIGHASNTLTTTLRIFNSTSGQFMSSLGWGPAASFYMNMAEFDLVTNGTQYKENLLSYFPVAEAARPSFLDQ